jgi:DNA helicase-2/ATP-dependent DNA helicase PcrA
MRFLTLWQGVGDVTAGKIMNEMMNLDSIAECIDFIRRYDVPDDIFCVLTVAKEFDGDVGAVVREVYSLMKDQLQINYKDNNWVSRSKDFLAVQELAKDHDSILSFLEDYILNPIFNNTKSESGDSDIVTVITVHSAKGAEKNVCYLVGVSPKCYPNSKSLGKPDEVEEERRVLYVGMTRAKNELILTRPSFGLWAVKSDNTQDPETYFLNDLPDTLCDMVIEKGFCNPNEFREDAESFNFLNKMGVDLS